MRWRWPMFRKPKSSAADEALETSKQQYEEVKSLRPEAEQVGRAHRRLRQNNHFGEAIRRSLEGR